MKRSRILLLICSICCVPPLAAQSLQEQLNSRRAGFVENAPPEVLASQASALDSLSESGIYDKVLKVGDHAPDFTLGDHEGSEVQLSELLKGGPVVLTWYRGGWCPYCNIALGALVDRNDEIRELGATLVALTPELPDVTAGTVTEHGLDFQVLSDLNHDVAEQYGLVFELEKDTAARYEERFKVTERSGEGASGRLPLPATYVINRDGIISWAFTDADYTRRAEPARILDALRALRDGPTGSHLVQQFWEGTWNPPYDLSLIDHLMKEDFVITTSGKDITGRDEFKEWVRGFQAKAPGLRLENLEIFESEDRTRTVSRWIARATNGGLLGTEADGQAVEFTGIAIWEIRDGRLAHNWVERSAWELYQKLQSE